MTLKKLFKKRSELYRKDLLKYARYIFNDHFSIVLVFLLGAGIFTYSSYLENLLLGAMQPQIFLVFFYFLLSLESSLTLQVEEADQVFLLAKEEEFYSILKQSTIKSYLLSLLPVGLGVIATYPVLRIVQGITRVEGLFIFLSLASLKWLHTILKIYPYFYQKITTYQKYRWFLWTLSVLGVSGLLFVNIGISTVLLLIPALITFYLFMSERIYFNHLLKWERMIQEEEARRNKLYRFIAVFVDIPQMESGVKRLAFLDWALDRLTQLYPTAPYYYSLRLVVRNTEYRSLIIRLNLMAILFLFLTTSYQLSLILTLFFLYILGFQLISLVQVNQDLLQFKMTPVSASSQVKSALYLIHQILILTGLMIGITATINLGWLGLTFFPITFLAGSLFSYYYVPYRLKLNEFSR